MSIRNFPIIVSIIILSAPSWASDPERVVVTATRLSTSEDEVASSAVVLDQKTLQRRTGESVAETMRTVPGLEVSRSGGLGAPTTLFVRGTNAEHTLVLIDGIKLNDAMSPTRSFDFGNLSLEGIERIEIVKGPQSVLYGSDAIGGVVQIITKKGSGRPKGLLGLGFTSDRTLDTWGSLSGAVQTTRYSLNAQFQSSGGYSAADTSLGNTEKDGRVLGEASGSFELSAVRQLPVELTLRYSQARFDNDSSGGPGGDDPDYGSKERKLISGVKVRSQHWNSWEPSVAFSFNQIDRWSHKTPNPAHTDFLEMSFSSFRISGENQNNFFLNDENTLVFGLSGEREQGHSVEDSDFGFGPNHSELDDHASIVGTYLQHQFTSNVYFWTAGARLDTHDKFGSKITYRVAPGVRIDRSTTTIRSSLGTGFKAPSLYQLYSAYGNTGLKPESNLAFDFSVDQELLNQRLKVTATYFQNSMTDLIDFDPAQDRYQSVGAAKMKGAEFQASAMLSGHLRGTASYTYTSALDAITQTPLLRRARHLASQEFTFIQKLTEVSLIVREVGAREDLDAITFQRKKMPGYAVADLSGTLSLDVNSKLIARITNLMNRSYEEVDGYGTPGRTVFFGYQRGFQ